MYNHDFRQNYNNYLNNNSIKSSPTDEYRPDYYNYMNNNYNKPLYTEDSNINKLYDPYQGFIRGNLFLNLYNGYKVNPMDLKPANEQAQLLTYLDSLDFATIDINLYLDVYPEDKDIIQLFNQYRVERNKLTVEYENKYGPLLTSSNANNQYPFVWVNDPWPWEGGK